MRFKRFFLASALVAGPLLASEPYSWVWSDMAEIQASLQSTPYVELILKDTLRVQRPYVYLSDCAECHGDKERCSEAYGIALFPSPPPGARSFFTRQAIDEILKAEWLGASWVLKGADRIQVVADEKEFRAEDIRMALEEALQKEVEEDSPYRLQINSLQVLKPIKLRPAPYRMVFPDLEAVKQLGFEGLIEKYKVKQKLTVRFELLEEDTAALAQEAEIFAKIDVLAQVLVAKRFLAARHPLASHDFMLEWQALAQPYEEYLVHPEQLGGMVLKSGLGAGHALVHQSLEKPFAVGRGERIRLLFELGDFTLSSLVRVKNPAAIGDVVDVVYEDTGKALRAKIVDSETAVLIR